MDKDNFDKQLAKFREDIDAIDNQLLELLNQRAQCALSIGEIKSQFENMPIYNPAREAVIFNKLTSNNKGPLSSEDVITIFQQIIAINRAIQQPISVAFLGPEGTFSHEAVIKYFGHRIKLVPSETIISIFESVTTNKADYGVVPVENSTEGVVNQTLDTLTNFSTTICGEIIIHIHQHFLMSPQAQEPIKRIYSHAQSLAQCEKWLNKYYPGVEKFAVRSNALAAKLASEEENTAAIASSLAAKQYGLIIKAECIEDDVENQTRFLIIDQHGAEPSGIDKTTLLIHTINKPGALAKISEPFFKHNINITLPACRPSHHELWDYMFFLDIEGHHKDPAVKAALDELSAQQIEFRILGSYPRARTD